MSKRGGMTFGQIVKLMLAVVVVVLLLTLAARLLSPIFDRGDETAKSYMKTLEGEIAIADKEETGEFYMWHIGDGVENKEFYLVYFGETIEVDFAKMVKTPVSERVSAGTIALVHSVPKYSSKKVQFNSFGTKSNRICICTVEDLKSACKYCEDLDRPVSFKGKNETWYEVSGKRIGIKLDKEVKKYVFSEIK